MSSPEGPRLICRVRSSRKRHFCGAVRGWLTMAGLATLELLSITFRFFFAVDDRSPEPFCKSSVMPVAVGRFGRGKLEVKWRCA